MSHACQENDAFSSFRWIPADILHYGGFHWNHKTHGLWIQGLPKISLIGHFLAMYEGNYMDSKKGPFFFQQIVDHITSIEQIGIFNTADFCSTPNQQPTYMFWEDLWNAKIPCVSYGHLSATWKRSLSVSEFLYLDMQMLLKPND